MGYKFINVDIEKLIINKENPRYQWVECEYDAIKNIILRQQEKLLNLIEDIAENGVNPSELIIVVEEGENYIVLEGNRRVTAIKLINDLDLYADIDSKFANKLSVILSKNSTREIKGINAILFDSRLEANRWIKIRHTGDNSGVGVLKWSKERKENFINENSKINRIYGILDYVRESKYYDENLKMQLDDVKVSQLSRLLDDPHVRETIGLRLKNKKFYRIVPEKELSKGLSKILYDILNGVFKGRSISTKENRLTYIEGFLGNQLPSYNNGEGEVSSLTITDAKEDNCIERDTEQMTLKDFNIIDGIAKEEKMEKLRSQIKNKDIVLTTSKSNRNKRRYLIPSDFNIRIVDKSIDSLYKELKTLDIKRYSNSVEVLFRMFLEKIVLNYVEKNNLDLKREEGELDLIENLKSIILDLKHKEKLTLEDEAFLEELLKSKKGIFKFNTFKEYILNKDLFIDIVQLKESWDLVECVIKELL
ncbi:ParB/Srx family N-terminal domain-containing protein [Clostridium massiliamazoniense]|uniref:ParB/Srx family N-terminal domain-containing protein n=1 Tax=Clostridium massiliamazoniense TaxID=1347366 RepID=UPI0006D7AF17|nr:ParB/Srx family N-terminal domain-containing protein [Clostridium massiliamazoniense]